MIDQDKIEELKTYYMTKYNESMESILNNITPQGDDLCFPCDKNRTYKYSMP